MMRLVALVFLSLGAAHAAGLSAVELCPQGSACASTEDAVLLQHTLRAAVTGSLGPEFRSAEPQPPTEVLRVKQLAASRPIAIVPPLSKGTGLWIAPTLLLIIALFVCLVLPATEEEKDEGSDGSSGKHYEVGADSSAHGNQRMSVSSTDAELSESQRQRVHRETVSRDQGITANPRSETSIALWDADRPRAIRALFSCVVSLVTVGMLETTFTLFVVPVATSLRVGIARVEVAFSILLVAEVVSEPIFSLMNERLGLRSVILCGAVLSISFASGMFIQGSLSELYMFYLMVGLALGAVSAPCTATCIRVVPPDKQRFVSGFASVAHLIGSLLAGAPTVWLIRTQGCEWAYLALGSVAVVALLVAALLCPSHAAWTEPRRDRDELGGSAAEERSQAQLGDLGSFSTLFIAFVAAAAAHYTLLANIQPILQSSLPEQSPVLLLGTPVGLAASACGRILWGRLAAIFSAQHVLTFASAGSALACGVWALALRSSAGSLLASAAAFFCAPAYMVCMPVVTARIFDKKRATMMYTLLVTADVAGALFAPVVAAMDIHMNIQTGWSRVLWLLVSASTVEIVCMLALPRSKL